MARQARRVNVLFADSAASAGLYEPASGYHAIGPMRTPRACPTATLLPDGSVLIAGGSADGVTAPASAEVFRLESTLPPTEPNASAEDKGALSSRRTAGRA